MIATPRVAIVGAGPAGLTAALTAHQLGLDVTVFEQAPRFDPIGGGILLHSNGLRVLDALGLLTDFAPLMRFISTLSLESAGGKPVFTVDYRTLPVPQAHGAVVMRHALEACLLQAVQSAGVAVKFGYQLDTTDRIGKGARLRFINGTHHETDVVIACDGVHSRVRETLGVPARITPTGQAFLRATGGVRMDAPTLREIWGRDGRVFGICPLPGEQTHFYCSVPFGQWGRILNDSLTNWRDTWQPYGPDVMRLLRAVPDWTQANYSETSEVHLRRWYHSPAFFVGDAAHAMRPNLGQGANMAMVDAFILMRLLAPAILSGGSLATVGHAYERLRRPFVSQVQSVARAIGMFASWTSAPARLLRDSLLWFPQHVGWIHRRGALLTAGYNPRENPFFALP